MTLIRTWSRYHKDKHSDKFSSCLSKNEVSLFEIGLDIIKTFILTKFQHALVKNAAPRVLTRFSFNLTLCPSFLPEMTHFEFGLEVNMINKFNIFHAPVS